MKADLNRLIRKPPPENRLDAAATPAAIRSKTGLERPRSGGAGGISSPLVETSYADRTFFSTYTLTSTDGLFVLELRRVNSMDFVDADGRTLTLEFKDV